MEELIAYAKQKNVGIILWVVWKTLDDQLQPALDQFARSGASRASRSISCSATTRLLINFYHKTCARDRQTPHAGRFSRRPVRPATMTRTWPNLISDRRRAAAWSGASGAPSPNPAHNVDAALHPHVPRPHGLHARRHAQRHQGRTSPRSSTVPWPWARAAINWPCTWSSRARCRCWPTAPPTTCASPRPWSFSGRSPRSGTRPGARRARSPSTSWSPAESGNDWYVGAMTNWTGRDLEVDLSFLPAGTFQHGELTRTASTPTAWRATTRRPRAQSPIARS